MTCRFTEKAKDLNDLQDNMENVIVNTEVFDVMGDQTKDEGQNVPAQGAPEEEPSWEELQDEFKLLFEEVKKKVPPEDLKEAEERVKEMLEGDMRWAELLEWPPEKLYETAQLGYRFYESGQYDKAEQIFKGLTILDPDNYYYHQILGAAYQQQKNYMEAVLEYSYALDLNDEDLVSRTNRGEVYFNMKAVKLAEQDFDDVIRRDSAGNDRWANRARMLQKKLATLKTMEQKSKSSKEGS
jgi:predicted Zn-dependent protease